VRIPKRQDGFEGVRSFHSATIHHASWNAIPFVSRAMLKATG
jgi:hypothetical protein